MTTKNKSGYTIAILHRREAVVLAAVTILGQGLSALRAEQVVYRKVAITGQQAPGTEPGTVFDNFAHGYTFPQPAPVVDDDGRVAFFGFLSGPSVSPANHAGIWTEHSGSVVLAVRAGSEAPGAGSGVVFRGFLDDIAQIAPELGQGRLAFDASVVGAGVDFDNDTGVWVGLQTQPALLIREGDRAPGTPPGVVFYTTFLSAFSESGRVLLNESLIGPGVTTANDEGFWSDRSGSLELILREGDAAPQAGPGVVFATGAFPGGPEPFGPFRANDLAELAVKVSLAGPGVGGTNDEALYVERSGVLTQILREGDPASGAGEGATFGGNSLYLSVYDMAFNDLGQIAFSVRLGGSRQGLQALYSNHAGTLAPLMIPGSPAPGTDDTFSVPGSLILSDGGHAAFRAALVGGGSFYPPLGVWWDQPGVMAPLVLPGQQLPGAPAGWTVAGIDFLDGYTASGVLALRGALRDPDGTYWPFLAFALPSGNVQVIAKEGELFDVAGDGGDRRTIARITPGLLGESGTIPFRLDFTDGSSAIYAATTVAQSAPGDAGGLRLDKDVGATLRLTWDSDCAGSTTYGVYRGDLTAGYASITAEPGVCSVGGTTTLIPQGDGQAEFFLVVPNAAGFEGSYGKTSLGNQRAPAAAACFAQADVADCAR